MIPSPLLAALQWDNVDRPWIWAGLVVAAAWFLWRTYRGIFQRSQERLAWGLMCLRGAGIAALVVALAQPAWQREREHIDAGRLAIVVDDSASMSLAVDTGEPRYARAKSAVEALRQAANAGDNERLEIDLFDVAGRPLVDGLPDTPRAERTDLSRAVRETIRSLRSRPLAGVALISDGMDNTGRDDLAELADSPVPVYTVGFEAEAGAARRDLSVTRATAPERVMVNNDVQVEVVVAHRGGGGVATLAIKRGRDEVASQEVKLDAAAGEQLVRATFAPREAGRFVYTAEVAGAAGETLLANNARHFSLAVDSQPIRVFYLEGFLREEYKFLKARLEDDPDISLVTVVRRANPREAAAATNVLTSERLAGFDVVILGDMEADYLSQPEQQALVDWLEGDTSPAPAPGGADPEQPAAAPSAGSRALLVLGGYQSFGPEGFGGTPLAGALPVVFAEAEPMQSEEPFTMQLTAEGQAHPIFTVTGDRVKDAELWMAVPPLLGQPLVARAKPGAEVLARNPSVAVEGQPAVVIASQRYGAGRTMVVAADTTWRWSRLARVLGQADTLYSRFWSQTIRWLAGREQDPERPRLVVDTDRPDYEVGKPVTVRVARQPQPGAAAVDSDVRAEVVDESGRAQAVTLRATSAEPDVFIGQIYPAAGGRYRVAATLVEDSQTTANQQAEFLVHGADLELAETGVNRARLEQIARATGGVYVDVSQAAQLADKIERRERRTVEVQRTQLGGSPWLFLFFLLAVTSEWVIRRRNHLV